jgi:transposase InsO family protein
MVLSKEPKSVDIRRFLGRVIGTSGRAAKYIISGKGRQFDCPGFRERSAGRKIQPHYASTEDHGAAAIIERFFRSLKDERLRRILVPLSRGALQRKISLYLTWYQDFRPHQCLAGKRPSEVYEGLRPANMKARFEP